MEPTPVEQSCHLDTDQRGMSSAESFNFSSKYASNTSDIYLSQGRQIPRLSLTLNHRNGFSKSMGDLSRKSNGCRKSVLFDEDLSAHKEMLQRARNRFQELELKYPELFKNPSQTSSLTSLGGSKKIRSPDRSFDAQECHEMQTKRQDTLQVLRSGMRDYKSDAATLSKRKPPPLSVAMKLHNLESSCDSAFDEIDHESMHSRVSHEPTPTSQSTNRFLYPGDSIESDKDSGISTDRPFIPSLKSSRPVRWAEPNPDDSKLVATKKSKSLLALSSRTNSQELSGSEYEDDNHTKRRIDRRGILKSVAYRNQEIKAESLDLPSASANSTANFGDCRGRQNRSRSLTGNLRRGTSIYRRSLFATSSSQDDTDSDAETIQSVQSELILRPQMSARERYFSTYQLNAISETSPNARVYKWRSMPELGRGSLGSMDAPSFYGDTLPAGCEEKRKKKRKFGRRSGLYVVNDIPVGEKPRLSIDKGKTRSKMFSRKSRKPGSVHVTDLTKTWFDNRTAVSQPTGGKSLGRIVSIREDLGSAYELELQRSPGGLFGFFIQKGYKQYRNGVFVSRIMDCSSSKFMAGLLNPGDEILQINSENIASKSMAEVHNILANSDKLLLTVLPFLNRKDW